MNYLAHLYYAGDDSDSILGNFLGDFIKGKIEDHNFSATTQAGIKLHRKIDKHADNKIISLLKQNSIHFNQRRYAGITFDLACDHFLALYWKDFHCDAIAHFAEQKIAALKTQEILLPEKGRQVLARMIEYKWLENYQDLKFLEQVFIGIHKRFPRENAIDLAFADLKNNYSALEESCLIFIKQLEEDILNTRQF